MSDCTKSIYNPLEANRYIFHLPYRCMFVNATVVIDNILLGSDVHVPKAVLHCVSSRSVS